MAVQAQDTHPKPLRRDAVRNHQLVVAAARDVLSEFGTDASMELIASRAGVGVGTVYRRFPNKEALVDEIAAQMLGELVGEARASLALPGGTGLEAFVRVIGRSLVAHRGYAHKLIGHSRAACVEQLRDLMGELLVQAKRAGRVAPGIELGDVMALTWGLRGVVETAGEVAPEAWQRYVDIQFSGLRCSAPTDSGPAVTRQQLGQISGGTDDGSASCT
ncbi:TetR/AcrR family transcriptional regulator [Streptomyces sp. V4-01]|uniref:TetR/AcrR family transcriptional regulator n=1 Tax=Actinacidiphila polyblastidii TaxID=3110430 RepID=A0ABU7PGQ0_9ACTN|nr:TetR/AcrR family transcriptional regulator [Streptomyces sp. V4-01]